MRRTFVVIAIFGLFSATLPVAEASASSSSCYALFTSEAENGLGINWTPFRHGIATPEVLADPYLQFAFKSDSFRIYLLQEQRAGRGIITDYKQIADATPVYDRATQAKLPDTALHAGRVRPESLLHQELVEYITTNYRLASNGVINKAYFSAEEKRSEHPLMAALRSQGLIELSQVGTESGLIANALQKLHQTWEDLLRYSPDQARDTLLPMPNKYVVAGGRFRESYFWDSYWIMKGLIESGYESTAKGMLENFVSLYERYGIIPNGNRFYYLTRTQLPLFVEMATLLSDHKILDFTNRDPKGLESRVLHVAEDYYESVWKNTDRYKSDFGLFGYSDGAGGSEDEQKVVVRPEAGIREKRSRELHSQRVYAESGWDMSYSRFGDRPQDWLPVDLNSILMSYNLKLARLFKKAGQFEKEAARKKESARIQKNIETYLLDRESGLIVDYNFATRTLSKTVTAASFFAFNSEIYRKSKNSKKVLRKLLKILKPKGHFAIHTTDREGEGQWDGSWSWAPLNEMAFQALLKYGLVKQARKLAFDYCVMTIVAYHKKGHTFYEKYLAENGEINLPADTEIYGNEEGFGWTNATIAVFLRALNEWGDLPALEKAVAKRLKNP